MLAALVLQPHDLERIIAFDQTVGIVVDGFAGTREQPGRGIVVAQNDVPVGVAALQRYPYRHLIDGTAGQGVRPTKRLRAQQDVQSKSPPLPDEAIEQQGCVLGDLVVLDKEFLEFIDDQQDARRGPAAFCLPVGAQVLRSHFTKPIAAEFQLGIEPLQDTEAEFALAFNRNHTGMRKRVGGVGLELDPFLEIDQVKFHFVGAVEQGEVADQGVQQGRFARTGFAGDEDVLSCSLTQF